MLESTHNLTNENRNIGQGSQGNRHPIISTLKAKPDYEKCIEMLFLSTKQKEIETNSFHRHWRGRYA